MQTPTSQAQPTPAFQLLWTIGFSGKRRLDPERGPAIARALRLVVEDFVAKAAAQNARLTAVSSLAQGGDVLFAEAVCSADLPGGPLPWKCLLPFSWEEFIRRDLACDATGKPLPEAQKAALMRRAEACRCKSIPVPEVTSPGANPSDDEEREEAYLECGYRTVDESDVMVCLVLRDEFAKLRLLAADPKAKLATPPGPGTLAVARYALAAGQPVVLLNAEADDIAASHLVLNPPVNPQLTEQWFVDPVVTELIQEATRAELDTETGQPEEAAELSGTITPALGSVTWIGTRLGVLANRHQGMTRDNFRWVLRCHLSASALAAVAATVLVIAHPEAASAVFLAAVALLALLKPGLAFAAWWIEHQMHHHGNREMWLNARVLAELCRGAIATWSLPIQPQDARDEEDFPKVKRMVRTLRLLREQDGAAAVRGTQRQPHETQLEADMREACRSYIQQRLHNQAAYYAREHAKANATQLNWRLGFQAATWTAILAGLLLAADRFLVAARSHLLGGFGERVLEAVIIIAPFVAAHCLGTMAILDTPRRCRRYNEMRDYLERLANTLDRTDANPSRIRLVEHAERTLIEEQHEWFSVMRNHSV
jgi:hypothetical protein